MAADPTGDFIAKEVAALREISSVTGDETVHAWLAGYASGLARGFKIARTGVPPAGEPSACDNLAAFPAKRVQPSTVEPDLTGEP